jgi:hypothetical protein
MQGTRVGGRLGGGGPRTAGEVGVGGGRELRLLRGARRQKGTTDGSCTGDEVQMQGEKSG